MSQENVEVVRAALETTSIHDVDAMIERLDPEVRFDLSERVFNPGVYEGHDGFRRFVQEIDEVWADFRIEPLEYIDAGEDKVVVSYLVRGRGKGSGVEVELPSTSVYTLRDGKLIEARMYREHGKALEAAGLRE